VNQANISYIIPSKRKMRMMEFLISAKPRVES
jgi:hypothetical protein